MGLWSAHHMLFLPLLRKGSPSPSPGWGPSHGRQFSMNVSSVSPSHGHQSSPDCSNVGHSSMRCSPSRTGCSSVGPPWGHKSFQETCSSMGSSLHRSAGPCQEPAAAQTSHGVTASSQASTCSSVGLLCGLQVDLCIHGSSIHGLQGHSCFTMVCTMGCRGIPAPAPGAPPVPPSALTLVSAELFLSHILILLFSAHN